MGKSHLYVSKSILEAQCSACSEAVICQTLNGAASTLQAAVMAASASSASMWM